MLASLYNWFWKAEHWIPPGLSWTDLEDSDGITYPHSKDLWMALPLTVVLILVRYLFERTIGLSLSRAMGVCDKLRVKAAPNPILESFFWTESQNPKEDDLSHLAHQCGLSLRKVQRWFRHKRKQEQPLLNKKFCESSWRFLFYFFSSIGGFFVLYKEPWFWEPRLCWEKYPKQPLQPALYWWFLLEIVFYLSLLLTMFSDVKRKDFKEQIIHHLVAITLLYFSYSANFLRIGALVMLLHDVSDVLLEAGKMFNYAKWKYSCDITFLIFALVFFVSRLIFFPTKVIYTTYHHSQSYFQIYFGFYFFNGLLMILQILHIFWFSLISRMLFKFILARGVQNDIRSDVEELDTSDDQSEKGKQKNEKFQTNDIPDACTFPQARGVRQSGSWRLARHVPTT
ncbi:ceramide synthase 4-like isoform X1 [Vombatus ursinus]|uniref:Ceramide synthase 4 n=1 Tax=Vombatus ursinus TaxID=29139 RepID=A0A4X2MCL9_VOMUR|nr:ceramide synthase 4-like isoform X1 [Vombatus ursinus]XP_027699875.1 ceramide synthase 4-like isoform X1 [Vombatus ursinus]